VTLLHQSTLPPAGPVERLLTKKAAAEILGVCPRTVDNLLARGQLRPVKLGSLVRVDPADLRACIESLKPSRNAPAT
jgi:excisionase family DNA binding protein